MYVKVKQWINHKFVHRKREKNIYISSVQEREKSLLGSGDGRLFNSQNSKEQIFNLFVWLLQSPYSRHANGINPCGKSLRKIKVKNLTFNIEKPFMLAIFGCCRHYYVRSVSDTTLSLFLSQTRKKRSWVYSWCVDKILCSWCALCHTLVCI